MNLKNDTYKYRLKETNFKEECPLEAFVIQVKARLAYICSKHPKATST